MTVGKGKFLCTRGVHRNDISSHIYSGHYYEFNEWFLPWTWKNIVLVSVLRKYLKITCWKKPFDKKWFFPYKYNLTIFFILFK